MKIKCTSTFSAMVDGKFYKPKPGEVIEVEATFAKQLIISGIGEEVKEEAPTVGKIKARVNKEPELIPPTEAQGEEVVPVIEQEEQVIEVWDSHKAETI